MTLVAPPAVELFGQATVPPVPPSPTPTPTPTAGPGAVPTTASPAATPLTPTTTPAPTTTTAPPGDSRGVEVDLMVLPRTVGGDPATELASDYGCPAPTALVPDPPRARPASASPRCSPRSTSCSRPRRGRTPPCWWSRCCGRSSRRSRSSSR
ncbi:hypothetical protein BJF78_16655 [Pseudonocardia sp. CNS-139]|nr:hypothetical protein BJF78_16655 [Pseudonocardia sp. CNS-139]